MKRLIGILRATIVGGVLFLTPFVVLIIILGEAHQLIKNILLPISDKIPVESLIGLETPKILAAMILFVICFLAGLLARTSLAKKLVRKLEAAVLSNLPGYSLMKNLGEEAAGARPSQRYESVLVQFDDTRQIGFLVERISGGKVVVFIPDAPNPWNGGVFIFDDERVISLQVNSTSVVNCLRKLGEGAGGLVSELKL